MGRKITVLVTIISMVAGSIFVVLQLRNDRFIADLYNAWLAVTEDPKPIGTPSNAPSLISIRVEEVRFLSQVGDEDGEGELHLSTIVVRRHDRSAKLSYPTEANYRPVRVGEPELLSDYSITINEIQPDEFLYAYFLALDEDDTDLPTSVGTDLILDSSVEALAIALDRGIQLPDSNIAGFFASWFVGNYAEWWRQADVIGVYRIDLAPRNDWLRNQTFEEISDDGNMWIRFSVIGHSVEKGSGEIDPLPGTRTHEPQLEATREILVTREIDVTRVVRVIVTRIIEVPQSSATRTTVSIRAISPKYDEYTSPVTFEWDAGSTATPPFRVVLSHPEKRFSIVGPWIGTSAWTTEIPKEQFGNWEWYLETLNGQRSETVPFVFNPHPTNSQD